MFLLFFICFLVVLGLYDLLQRKHAILRNFPLIGHFRYLLESVGPELRQYIVTDNNEERPFSRNQRRWVYASSKGENDYFGFGTDFDLELASNYLIIKHSSFPYQDNLERERQAAGFPIPCAKILGGHRKRRHAFRPHSIVNISGMSFGSLSGPAVEALNAGAALANCLQNTGEGGVSVHHKKGGELIWQIGTGYFGCRDKQGNFSLDKFKETIANNPIRAIEIKLSQGAKPGLGGVLPAKKVSEEISRARGVPLHQTCISPPKHKMFRNPDEMLDFVELLADTSGLPIGIKSAVGELSFWEELAQLMKRSHRGVDFITVDGGEGGTGAGPLVFTDHVSLPFKIGFSRVFKIFAEADLTQQIVFIGSGKLGFPEPALFAFSLGCDLLNVGRESMLAIGCIQAQRCHTNNCPTGVTTHNPWLQRGLVPSLKSVRLANYLVKLRKEILHVSHACGVEHPALVTSNHLEVLDDRFGSRSVHDVFGYMNGWGIPSEKDCETIRQMMHLAQPENANA